MTALAGIPVVGVGGVERRVHAVHPIAHHALPRLRACVAAAARACADIGGDEQRIDRVDTDHSAETFKHILLPVWMAAYNYNGRSYRFVVNGQTGRVQGERPWSAWKIAFAVIAAAIVAGGFAYLGQR